MFLYAHCQLKRERGWPTASEGSEGPIPTAQTAVITLLHPVPVSPVLPSGSVKDGLVFGLCVDLIE